MSDVAAARRRYAENLPADYQPTPDADPVHLYEDVLVALRFVSLVGIIPCVGGQRRSAQKRLEKAFAGGGAERVRWLRRDPHDEDTSCWLHGEDTCLSVRSDQEDEP